MRQSPERNAAATRRSAASNSAGAIRRSARRRSGSSLPACAYRPTWRTRTARKLNAKRIASSPKACGRARARPSIAAVAASTSSRTPPSSTFSVLVSQAYPVQAHQTAARESAPRITPCQLGSCVRRAVTCVIANTNTRSKNSSSGVTACSPLPALSSAAAASDIGRDPVSRGQARPPPVVRGGAAFARSVTGRGRLLVLGVGDVLAPSGGRSCLVGLLQGEVCHEAVRCGSVPVFLPWLEEHTVAGSDGLDRAAAPLAEADSFENEDRLPVRVGVPGGAGAGREVHERATDPEI